MPPNLLPLDPWCILKSTLGQYPQFSIPIMDIKLFVLMKKVNPILSVLSTLGGNDLSPFPYWWFPGFCLMRRVLRYTSLSTGWPGPQLEQTSNNVSSQQLLGCILCSLKSVSNINQFKKSTLPQWSIHWHSPNQIFIQANSPYLASTMSHAWWATTLFEPSIISRSLIYSSAFSFWWSAFLSRAICAQYYSLNVFLYCPYQPPLLQTFLLV